MNNYTYGMELEYADIRTDRELPEGLTWNDQDNSIVSSTGIANDPKRKLYKLGGEINSAPTDTIDGQVEMFKQLMGVAPEARVSYRTNLHIHIRVPGLIEDLPTLKQILSYNFEHQKGILDIVEPIPGVPSDSSMTPSELKGALARAKRRSRSHQFIPAKKNVERALAATTVDEFLAGHAPAGKNGPAWGLVTPAACNLVQLRDTGTIEFRHYTCTRNPQFLYNAFNMAQTYLECAINGYEFPTEEFAPPLIFEPFHPYNHAEEIGYKWTSTHGATRKVVEQRLAELSKHFDLYNCKAAEIAPFIVEQSGGKLAL